MNWWQKIVLKIVLNKKGVKQMLEKIKQTVSGKKTYLITIVTIIGVIIAWSQGTIDTIKAIEAIVAAITAMTLRAGIAKSGPTE